MYRTVVFFTNLWMRLFPNYTSYFLYSQLAALWDQIAFDTLADYWSRASTLSRGSLLPEQWEEIKEMRERARALDVMARSFMKPITVEDLKHKHEWELT